MSTELKPNRRSYVSAGNILTILGMVGGLLAVWGTLAGDNADTKRRLSVVEERQVEARTSLKEAVGHVDVQIKVLDSKIEDLQRDVHSILRKLEAMEAVEKERDRERTRRGS